MQRIDDILNIGSYFPHFVYLLSKSRIEFSIFFQLAYICILGLYVGIEVKDCNYDNY